MSLRVIARFWSFGTTKILEAGYWMPGTGFWRLDTGFWILYEATDLFRIIYIRVGEP